MTPVTPVTPGAPGGTGASRTVPVLAASQLLGGVGVASGVAVNGLLAQQLSGSASLAGVAQTMGVVGAAAMALPLARLASSRGRRPALAAGYVLGTAGGLISIVAALLDRFGVLLVGAALFGGGTAAGLQSRYAAIDGVPVAHRGRSLSLVIWATTVGSVAGPNLGAAGAWVARRTGVPPLAGPYFFSVAAFLASAVVVAAWLRPDPLQLAARRRAGHTSSRPASPGPASPGPASPGGSSVAGAPHPGPRAALDEVRRVPGARLGLVAVGSAHAVMVAVMVMTPVHLHDGGAGLDVVGYVISAHIAGMYALSPVFGALSDRLGRRPVIGLGVALLALATLLAGTAGDSSRVQVGIGLVVLGAGWSACVVAGSTLLSESVGAAGRTAVQGLSDLVMGVSAAAAGVLAGPVLGGGGYSLLNALAAVLLVPVVLLVLVPRRPPRPPRPA